MTDHKQCPTHRRRLTEETVEWDCATDGSTLVAPRCPQETKAGTRCPNGVGRGFETCWAHSERARARNAKAHEAATKRRAGLKAYRARQRVAKRDGVTIAKMPKTVHAEIGGEIVDMGYLVDQPDWLT